MEGLTARITENTRTPPGDSRGSGHR